MKTLINYINESSSSQPFIKKFYRANIGRMSDSNDIKSRIGDVTELTYKSYSDYRKSFTFGEPRGAHGINWKFAMNVKETDNNSKQSFDKFLDSKNKEDKFYQYFLEKSDADKVAQKAKKEYESKKWTLNSLLKDIKADKDLVSLKYDYHITDTYQQKNKNIKLKSIYVSSSWRIFIDNNKIFVQRASWNTYEVPNLQSLYKVLSADSGSDSDEGQRQNYSIVH